MVWGMTLPTSFGQFWPSGEFEYDAKTRDTDWYNRLSAYYEAQTPEEQKRLFDYRGEPASASHFYSGFAVYKLTKEPGTKYNSGFEPPYGIVESHEVPRSFDTDKNYSSLGSLIKLNDRILAVDEQLKAIIERLEPGLHQFFPIPITMPKGRVYPDSYYVLRVCQYIDAFARYETWEGSFDESTRTPSLLFLNTTKKAINGLAMRQAAFGDAHLWRDRAFGEELACLSDELMAEIETAGLRLPKHFKMKGV